MPRDIRQCHRTLGTLTHSRPWSSAYSPNGGDIKKQLLAKKKGAEREREIMKCRRVKLEWDEEFKEVTAHVGNWRHLNQTSAIVLANLVSTLHLQKKPSSKTRHNFLREDEHIRELTLILLFMGMLIQWTLRYYISTTLKSQQPFLSINKVTRPQKRKRKDVVKKVSTRKE